MTGKSNKRGQKPFEFTKEMIERIERLASQGLTQEQISLCLGVSVATFYKYKACRSEMADAIKRGQSKGIEDVTNALFENATGGDNTAAIFYLKNRNRKEWGERKAIAPTIDFKFDATLPPNEQAAQIMQAAADGKLPSDIAQNYMNMIASTVKIDEMTAMAEKLKEIEKLLGVEHG